MTIEFRHQRILDALSSLGFIVRPGALVNVVTGDVTFIVYAIEKANS